MAVAALNRPARPPAFEAVIFDMDGVVTRTAGLHAAAWKELFDDFLRRRAAGGEWKPFDARSDYLAYVDGRPRHEGVRHFLAARGIELPEGDPADDARALTVHGLGKRKDELFERELARAGVETFASTVALIRALRAQGVKTAVVTSSRHGGEIIAAAGLQDLFDARLDGVDAGRLRLRGKPDPETYTRCAEILGVPPAHAVVVEDAVSGVEAGRRGGFGLVVGVDRGGNREALAANGADLVVGDPRELGAGKLDDRFRARRSEIAWHIEQEGYDPAREHGVESLFTVGNGYLGVRGALDSPLPGSYGDLFVAGVYDRKDPDQPYSELEFLDLSRDDYPYGELVSAPFPFRMGVRVDGAALDLGGERWRSHRRVLDLRRGILHAQAAYETGAERRTAVRTRRCASRADLHLLLQEIAVQPENHPGTVELDLSLACPDLAPRHPHLVAVTPGAAEPGVELHRYRTRASGIEICIAARSWRVDSGEEAVRWLVESRIGETLLFRRYVAVYTSRDTDDPQAAALAHLRRLRTEDFEQRLGEHAGRWEETWQRADIRVTGSPAAEQALRFHAYHLVAAADRDPRVSVGGRSLTGRAYEGHVFWDVEIFMLPFYLHVSPEVACHLLRYRHHTLDGARRRASALGYRGACFAWESTVTGEDVTPRVIVLKTTRKKIPIFTGTQQVHVTADVAYGIWRYWEATRDEAFLRDAGAEILAETARFWASRCTREGNRFHIRGVVGPDEYHHGVNDNAYTNWMARFNLEQALWAVEWMRREQPQAWAALRGRLGLAGEELAQWAAVARELHCPGPNADGVIEQFEGFFDLEDYPLPKEERFKAPINRLFDWDRINRLKLIKQADVLMLFHLFPERFPPEVVAANYRYYEPLTDHCSSLSPAIHAAIAARLGRRDDAERYFRQSLWLDLSDVMGNSALGVHPACMGGTWQALVFGFLGVRLTESGPVAGPDAGARLPEAWQSVSLKLAWRGGLHAVEAGR